MNDCSNKKSLLAGMRSLLLLAGGLNRRRNGSFFISMPIHLNKLGKRWHHGMSESCEWRSFIWFNDEISRRLNSSIVLCFDADGLPARVCELNSSGGERETQETITGFGRLI